MKLIDFYEGLSERSGSWFNEIGLNASLLMKHDEIKAELMKCDEFKNVKKINLLQMPTYIMLESTGEPTYNNVDYIGQKTKAVHIPVYKVDEDTEFEFSEIVDLHTIINTPKIYDPNILENLECGVWKTPRVYNTDSFIPSQEIRVIFNPETIQDIICLENKTVEEIYKERIEPKVRELFLNREIISNLPHRRGLLIRCSKRSIKIKEKTEK